MNLELSLDRLAQIYQITAVAELQHIHLVPWLELWGGQVKMTVTWRMTEPVTVSVREGMTPLSMSASAGDLFTLNYDYAPLHIVKAILEDYGDKCRFDSAHEKAEVMRVYCCAPLEV